MGCLLNTPVQVIVQSELSQFKQFNRTLMDVGWQVKVVCGAG